MSDSKSDHLPSNAVSQLDRGGLLLDKQVWKKLDKFVLPLATLFYFFAFLDRANIGNARVAGLQRDLEMTDHQYSIALTVTYIPYILTELPANWVLKVAGPNHMLPTMMALWGVVTICQGVVKTYGSLLACRFFIGFFEGGLFPGLTLYLSYFYPRRKMNLRISTFFAAASLSGAFSGILAFGIVRMDGVGGRTGWSWIFILEGLITVLFALLSYLILPRDIEGARFLNKEEKDYVVKVLGEDYVHNDADAFTWKEVRKTFAGPQVWFVAFSSFMVGTISYSLSYFLPSILRALGYTSARAQLMSVPPFVAGFIVSLICAFISDKFQCRGLVVIFGSTLAVIGFSVFLSSQSTRAQYASLFFSVSGTFTAGPTLGTWASNNATPQTRRATAIAVTVITTNGGGVLATWLLGSLSEPPRYTGATVTLLVLAVCIALGAAGNLWYLKKQNGKKAAKRRTISRDEEKPGIGDKSAWFVYTL